MLPSENLLTAQQRTDLARRYFSESWSVRLAEALIEDVVNEVVKQLALTPCQLTEKQLLECIPKVQLGKETPVTMVWMQQRDAIKAMRAAIALHQSTVTTQYSDFCEVKYAAARAKP